jgi:hypothetical protein
MHFTPEKESGDQQSQLKLFIIACLHDPGIESIITSALENGPIRKFYALNRVNEGKYQWEKYGALCEIRRRTDQLKPPYDQEFNTKTLESYYTITAFDRNDRNDYMDVDLVLSHTSESILIDLCAQPVDISNERSEHARYLAALRAINSSWERNEDETDFVDYVGEGSDRWASSPGKVIEPPHYHDLVADDILRNQQRFHQSLLSPHLLFRFSIFAETMPVARLIGSFVAESAFNNGSYELMVAQRGEEHFQRCLSEARDVAIG